MPKTPHDVTVANAISQLSSIFGDRTSRPISGEGNALWLACETLGAVMGIEMIRPNYISISETTSVHDLLTAIAHASRFQIRQVALKGQWWEFDNGPLLGFDRETGEPIAMTFNKKGHYQALRTQSNQQQLLTPEFAKTLDLYGYSFYRCFPDTVLNVWSVMKFAMRGQWREIRRILFLQVMIGLLVLAVPIATGILLDVAVPTANINLLTQWIIGLLVILGSTVAFNSVKLVSLIRWRFKTNFAVQAAVWDRLIRLPVNFFRHFTPGDLADRASGIDTMQQELTDATLQTFLGGIFSLLTLILMFYYSPLLALFAIIVLVLFIGLMVVDAWIQLKYQRPMMYLHGQIATLVFQFITSISKLRVSNSEERVFALWAEQFAKKTRLAYKGGIWGIQFNVANNLLYLFGIIGLYALIGFKIVNLSFGSFIAFNAAFAQFFVATLGFAGILNTWINLIPLYERIKPILIAQPEAEREGIDPGILSGKISLEKINFRYVIDGPLILENISMTIQPGEMVALVGATGAGKSTLFRMLLAFETPLSGQIFFNDQELAKLNVRIVREQIGVVLQNAKLLPGNIFENIAGTYPISEEKAWEAARQAGLVDDIKEMPMGMFTLVSEGGKTLSVGQCQRLMIARALARNPRILFLDEATSALDNPTQAEIMKNLEELNITRVIAAHRLSTLTQADRIYVLEQGKIVQTGTYAELIASGGLFTTLVQRQLLS